MSPRSRVRRETKSVTRPQKSQVILIPPPPEGSFISTPVIIPLGRAEYSDLERACEREFAGPRVHRIVWRGLECSLRSIDHDGVTLYQLRPTPIVARG